MGDEQVSSSKSQDYAGVIPRLFSMESQHSKSLNFFILVNAGLNDVKQR